MTSQGIRITDCPLTCTGTEDFANTVFGIIESIAQHPTLLIEYHSVIIDHILRSLAQLISASSGK